MDVNDDVRIIITDHAYQRAKERLSLNAKTFYKLALKALDNGITHSQTKGKLNRYITSLFFKSYSGNNVRIYGDNIYIFDKKKLITVYRLPGEFLPIVRKILKINNHNNERKRNTDQDT